MQHKLYEHSLIIGNILGGSYYSKAMTQFVNDNLVKDCSLRSIYLLTADSGTESDIDNEQQLASKWKKQVSILLSNSNSNSKTTLGKIGDKLWQNHRDIVAAHFCYLIAGINFQPLHNKNSRVVLLGGDHKRSNSFVSPATICLSEILDYVHSIHNSSNSCTSLVQYKFILAAWLQDVGLSDISKNYFKQIQQSIK